jgi:formylmethanofuran dehydrogenase subunit A
MSCNCKQYWDVRAVCHPTNNTWKKCPVRANTAYWLIGNDYEIYKMVQNGGLKRNKIFVIKQLKITDKDWEQMMIWEKDELID